VSAQPKAKEAKPLTVPLKVTVSTGIAIDNVRWRVLNPGTTP
jgi:hypothetical protein